MLTYDGWKCCPQVPKKLKRQFTKKVGMAEIMPLDKVNSKTTVGNTLSARHIQAGLTNFDILQKFDDLIRILGIVIQNSCR